MGTILILKLRVGDSTNLSLFAGGGGYQLARAGDVSSFFLQVYRQLMRSRAGDAPPRRPVVVRSVARYPSVAKRIVRRRVMRDFQIHRLRNPVMLLLQLRRRLETLLRRGGRRHCLLQQ